VSGPSASRRPTWLEHVTAGVLLLVLLALGWMVLAAYWPGWASWTRRDEQVFLLLTLLSAALVLVSVVALRHTRA
jgi:CHASE2 domain-containing sensor protein